MISWCFVGFALGLIIGSFIGALAMRWPRGESVLSGRSHCDHCWVELKPSQLIPVASFVTLRGRCGACGTAIPVSHLLAELAGGVIGFSAFGLSPGLAGIAGAVFGWSLLALGLIDFSHFWLPDRLTIPLTLLGFALGAAGIEPTIIDRLIGAVAGLSTLLLIGAGYRSLRGRQGVGTGDAKLMCAIGAWLGWQPLPFVILAAAALGFAYILILHAQGRVVSLSSRLPLGTLLAMSAWLAWIYAAATQG